MSQAVTSSDSAGYQHIEVDAEGAVRWLTMNRPDKRNALSEGHMTELLQAVREAGADPDCAVVVLRARGPAFCAGHDLSELAGREPADYQRIFALCAELMTALQQIRQPVIAAVHALATAAGAQLAASCDLVVAAEEASFATPGVRIGLFCSTPMVALSRVLAPKKCLEMLLTGEAISATEAMGAGLVNRVVPAAELDAAVRALAARIAQASSEVVGIGKQAFYRQLEMPLEQAYRYAQEVMAGNACHPDAQEGIGAFLDKRAPVWRGR